MRRSSLPSLRIYALMTLAALLLLGTAQAAWNLRLQILGTINTSDAAMIFTAGFTNDDGVVDDEALDPGDTGSCQEGGRPESSCDPGGGNPNQAVRLKKDIARCAVSLEPDGLVATMEMDDAYPAYQCTAWFVANNSGSLPLRISGLRLNETPIGIPSVRTADLNEDNAPDVRLQFEGVELCQQLDPGDDVALVLQQQLLGGAPPNSSLSFSVELSFAQWNAPCEAGPHRSLEEAPGS